MRVLRRFPVLVAVLMAATTVGAARPAAAQPAVAVLHATLLGTNEVPGPGDPNATGSATIMLNSAEKSVCFVIRVQNTPPLLAAHIHRGGPHEAGPVVVPLAPLTGGPNRYAGCTTAPRATIRAIVDHPRRYYVNVHNAPFPAGAARGQLSRLTAAA
jgi:hypothetical protein